MEVPPSFRHWTSVAEKRFEKDFLDIESKQYCKNLVNEIEDWKKTMEENLSKKIEEVADNMKRSNLEVTEKFILLDRDLSKRMDEIKKSLTDDLKKKTKELEEKLNLIGSKFKGVETQLDLSFTEIGSINNYIIGALLLVLFGVIFAAYKSLVSRKSPNEKTGHPVETHKTSESGQKTMDHRLSINQSFDTIRENLKRKGLKKGLLVISFHPSTQQSHRDALNAVSEFKEISPLKVLVQRSNDLTDVETRKLVIIFVDFNNRNIILEEEEAENGDLRNQTTKIFKFLKCDVFVVYCKDKGSQNLPRNNLYNPRLHSIERHPVLSELKMNNRVLTINDKFHPHQVDLLRKCCQL
ncbi:uncharacterized protein LOC111123290 [Crassostrea virginica]